MELSPLIVTLKTSAVATTITFFAGIFLAYIVSNLKRGKSLVDALIMLPMVLPPTVVGFFLLLLLGKRSAIGKFLLQFDINFVFTWKAAVIAAVVVSLPLMYRTTRGVENFLANPFAECARRNFSGIGLEFHAGNGRIRSNDNVRGQRAGRDANYVHSDLRGSSSKRLRLSVQMGGRAVDFLADIHLRHERCHLE